MVDVEVKCLECGAVIPLPDDVMVGEIITCPDCGQDYEVWDLNGEEVVIRPAELEGEDWGE